MGLEKLVAAGYAIYPAVFEEFSPGLVKTERHILISVTPVRGHTLFEAVNPFGEEVEIHILTAANHLPAFLSPLVGIFQQEV